MTQVKLEEITPLALAKRLRVLLAEPGSWKPGICGGLFYDAADESDRAWGPPLVSDPPAESKAKIVAVNHVRRAIADCAGVHVVQERRPYLSPGIGEPGIGEWEECEGRTHQDVLDLLERVEKRLEEGSYSWDSDCRLFYTLKAGS